ncbi:hypothetical protein CDL12_12265 [Handroanthus impetiginosus]|uniref:RNase H type-1 domain-containing protein n=1 Tax=Handroanthus impetiginosus TaxID=429701 RepID=A0A2G9HC78_9LAMI|nr:hypothetical protein CDL12_12265 [Handroanthus impetiginosus]
MQPVDFDLFDTVCWKLWNERNKAIFEEHWIESSTLAGNAKRYLEEFNLTSISHVEHNEIRDEGSRHLPGKSVIKGNFDGAIFKDSNSFGVSKVTRDSQRNCLSWATTKERSNFLPTMVEAKAATFAIVVAREKGWDNVEFDGNNMGIINSLKSLKEPFR